MNTGAKKRQRTAAAGAPAGECLGPSQDGGGCSLQTPIEKELERALRDFVRLRTVSSDPTLREDCFRGAKFLATLLESLGALPPALWLLHILDLSYQMIRPAGSLCASSTDLRWLLHANPGTCRGHTVR